MQLHNELYFCLEKINLWGQHLTDNFHVTQTLIFLCALQNKQIIKTKSFNQKLVEKYDFLVLSFLNCIKTSPLFVPMLIRRLANELKIMHKNTTIKLVSHRIFISVL